MYVLGEFIEFPFGRDFVEQENPFFFNFYNEKYHASQNMRKAGIKNTHFENRFQLATAIYSASMYMQCLQNIATRIHF